MGLARTAVRAVEVTYTGRQAQKLIVANQPERAIRLVESKAGLVVGDYRSRARLRAKLDGYLSGVADSVSMQYVLLLVATLGADRHHAEALRVLEVYFGFGEGAGDLVARVRERLERMPDVHRVATLVALVPFLATVQRQSEGTALLAADLGVGPAPEAAEVRDKVARRLAGFPRRFALGYVQMVALSVGELGAPPGTEVALLEDRFGLQEDDYASPEHLGVKLTPWLRAVPGGAACLTFAVLAQAKADTDPGKALALLEWCVGITPDAYRDHGRLAGAWRDFCDRNHPEVGPTFWRAWSGILVADGRHDEALALAAADNDVEPEVLASPERFGPTLERRLQHTRTDTRAAYVFSLVSDLADIGERDTAHHITDWYLRGYANLWRVPADGDPGVVHIIPLLGRWLAELPHREPEFVWQASEQAVLYLRRSLLLGDSQMPDRREFITYVDTLRRQILQTADRWGDGRTPDPERVLQAQLWDAELGQRILFEEFLLTRVESLAPAEVPEDRWPLRQEEPAYWDSHLPDPDTCHDEDVIRLLGGPPGVPEDDAAEARRGENGPPAEEPPAERAQWLRDAEHLVRQGVTRELLVDMLGDTGLLVRVGFRADNALVWAALRRGDGPELTVAAADSGRPGDLWRLRWAAFRHDLGLLLATGSQRQAAGTPGTPLAADPAGAVMDPAESLVDVLLPVLASLTAALDRARDTDRTPEQWLAETAPDVTGLDSSHSGTASRERLGNRLAGLLRASLDPEWWPGPMGEQLAATTEVVTRHQAAVRDRATRPDGRNALHEIDDVTRAHLAEVARIWPLDRLQEHLDTLPDQSHDLVFQMEDTLQSVPVAHLPLPDRTPLYARVRSVRVSLSVLMTLMQQRVERRFATDTRRILVVSHFNPVMDPDNAEYARWLHHGQRRLAHASGEGMVCLNAAEEPPGVAGALRAALDEYGSFQTVTVCGHGSAAEAGVRLGDGMWAGGGCDWGPVNLLLLPSCSVGRLEQTLDYDVEGLCVRLALHRARSVLACRWPVITPQAIAFANEVVACYLDLRRQADEGAPGAVNLRARAVNAARHRFLRGGDTRLPGEIVQLNTVAAYELYGLG
ncbi:hypothetical protein KQY30_03520 [Streptomyces sp. GMY02]|uniref:hypothetical protein n=1 Tax=Streptomyces sp. GMY02 TaxID=1333528 RepID=UPI001C2B9F6E|nr:hypothetical protein [Streptomyces sp. GMY02]QXE33495.1 hypothetical protein KQY30_03520 [Streptomyces sp. GMY02]